MFYKVTINTHLAHTKLVSSEAFITFLPTAQHISWNYRAFLPKDTILYVLLIH